VSCCKGGNEVIFIRSDGALGGVLSAVVDGRDVLVIDGGGRTGKNKIERSSLVSLSKMR
jgi:hypothetical protein